MTIPDIDIKTAISAAIASILGIAIISVLAAIFIACGVCVRKRKRKGNPKQKEFSRDLETGVECHQSSDGTHSEPSENRPMLLAHNIPPNQLPREPRAKVSESRGGFKERSESQRGLLSHHNHEMSPDETVFPVRTPSFKSAMQSPASTGEFNTPPSGGSETEMRRSTCSEARGVEGNKVPISTRCNTAPSLMKQIKPELLIPLLQLPQPGIPLPYSEAAKPNSPLLLDKSVPIDSTNPTLMDFGGGDVQLSAPISLKEMGENYNNITVMDSLDSQSSIPPTHKRKNQSVNADTPDTSGNKKLHIEFSTDVNANLADRMDSIQADNKNIIPADVILNLGDSYPANSMLSDPEMPSVSGKQVTLSETDSEGVKNYVQYTYGPEEDVKLSKNFVSYETDGSDNSVCPPVSKEVRDRHMADNSLENVSVGSSATADMLGINSLSPTHSQTRKELESLNETNRSFPDTFSSAPHTDVTIPDTHTNGTHTGVATQNVHTNAPDITTVSSAGNICPQETTPSIPEETNAIGPDVTDLGSHSTAPHTSSIGRETNAIGLDTNSIVPVSHTIGPIADSGYPDILNSNPTKPDVISHVTHIPEPTLDGPANNLRGKDFTVNSITGTISSFDPDTIASSMDTTNSNASGALPGYPYPESSTQDPADVRVNSDVSVIPISVASPQREAPRDLDYMKTDDPSFSRINVEEGLGPNYMFRTQYNLPDPTFSLPSLSPSDKTVYLSGSSENEFKSFKSDYTSIPDTPSVEESSSPLSLYEHGATLDPNIDYAQLLDETVSPDKQQQINLDNNTDFSMIMQNCFQQDSTGQEKEITPTSSLQPVSIVDNTSQSSSIAHISESPPRVGVGVLTQSLPSNGDCDTIVSERADTESPINIPSPVLEVDSIAPGNDAVPLNEDSIVPAYVKELNLPQKNEMDFQKPLPSLQAPAKPAVLPTNDTHTVQRSVDAPITFRNYIAKEWIGTSDNAKRVRNGYSELEKMGYTHLMSIRGDNYCAVRSTLFQTFCIKDFNRCSFLADMKPPTQARLVVAPMMEKYPFLAKWSFASKAEFTKLGTTREVLELCIANLAHEVETVRNWDPLDRMVYIYSNLNQQKEIFDFSLMEALKFYMFMKAAEFWEAFSYGMDLPDQMFFLFLREDSVDLKEFLLNHLNNVGYGGGLEMIEMFLLGHTLDLQIKVTRISSFGKEDYLTYFPPGNYPSDRIISISAEDDRHYNVLTTLSSTDDFFLPEGKLRKL